MLSHTSVIISMFIVPLLGACLFFVPLRDSILLRIVPFFTGFQVLFSVNLLLNVMKNDRVFAFGKLFFADMLSAFELLLVSIVFFMASLYMIGYFEPDTQSSLKTNKMRRFIGLWHLFLFTMTLVFLTNNLGFLWVSIEATTLASAFLILTKGHAASIEAMWKYLLVCSVGIAFGLIGTLLLSAASQQALTTGIEPTLLWTELKATSALLDKGITLAAFVFVLVGFGTKAGLAPMHTWLPDAHSQAPSPVSAVFSAVMLNSALYAIFRFLPLVEGSLGMSGQARALLLFFGLISIGTAMVFIPSQRDIKRFLAYSSIEHIGVISTGVGLGGIGVTIAMFHTLNHSIAKMLAFFSAGKLVQSHNTYDMDKIHGAIISNRMWGTGFFLSTLALIGAAPFAIFMSELQILKTGFDQGRYVTLAYLLFAIAVIFIAAFKQIMKVTFGTSALEKTIKSSFSDKLIVFSCLSILIVFGLYMPDWLWNILDTAANSIGK